MTIVIIRLTATFNLGSITCQMMILKSIRYAYSRSTVICTNTYSRVRNPLLFLC